MRIVKDFSSIIKSGLVGGFLLVLSVVVFFIYIPSLSGQFVLDDLHTIVENPSIRINRMNLQSLLGAAKGPRSMNSCRPLAYISFALNYMTGGTNPRGYRLVNIGILVFSIPLAFYLALSLSRSWLDPKSALAVSLATVILWALHPLLTSGVSYIVQRMTSLSTLLSLAALACFFKGLKSNYLPWFAGSLLIWIAALATKEIAVLVPLIAAFYAWYILPHSNRYRHWIAWCIGSAIIASQIGMALLFYTKYIRLPFTLTQRLLTELRVVLHYITLFLLPLPSRLNLYYDYRISESLTVPMSTLAAGLIHVLIAGMAWHLRKRQPLYSFCILSFYLLQLLESTALPLEIIFEHRVYFPSFFLSLGLMGILHAGGRKVFAHGGRANTVLLGLAILGGIWMGFFTYQRNLTWSDPITLWQDVVKKSPRNAKAYNNLGLAYSEAGRDREAVTEYLTALEIDPDSSLPYFNLGRIYFAKGDSNKAANYFMKALQIQPDLGRAHNSLGIISIQKGKPDEAIKQFKMAIRYDPENAEAFNNLGNILFNMGSVNEAIIQYKKAIEINPFLAEVHYNLGCILSARGRVDEADFHFREALEIDPDLAEIKRNRK